MEAVSQSPLNEVDKDSLAELFAKDPLELTQSDVTRICVELRAQRAKWQQDDRAKSSGKGKTAKVALSKAEMDDLLNLL